jgi:hypothetical protein
MFGLTTEKKVVTISRTCKYPDKLLTEQGQTLEKTPQWKEDFPKLT